MRKLPTANPGACEALRLLLLRNMPEQGLRSMERFADELERAFAERSDLRVNATTVHASPLAARLGLRRTDSYLARFVRYPLAARRHAADVYHIVDQGYAHLAAFLPRERVVASCHDLMLLKAEEGGAGFRGGRASLLRFRWSTSYLRQAARVVCPSQATKADLMRLRDVPADRISVVPYGVGRHFRPLSDEARGLLKAATSGVRERAVLHISTGGPYKNVPATLRVIAALRQRGFDVALVRAGQSLDASERALAEHLQLADVIVDCGPVSEERLVELYNACDVLLFPSHYEGFGLPPLEAMACGTPVVASNCPALVEVVEDAGLLAPPDDIDALASAVGAVLEPSELARRLRQRGLERAAELTWERTAAGFAGVYEAVAERAREHAGEATRERAACAE